jgi:hypothetical protein
MLKLLRVIPALALATLAGCVSQVGERKDWAFQPASKDEPVKLTFGRPDTDDVDLLLWCDIGKHQVEFTPVGRDDERFGRITLRSGAETLHLDLHQDRLLGTVGVAPLDTPVLAAFRLSNRLRMTLDAGQWQDLRARGVFGRRQIRAFFDLCH